MGELEVAGLRAREGQIYLAGAIEKAPDGGKAWRSALAVFLQEQGFRVFNPCINEEELLSPEEKVNFREWKVSCPERFMAIVRRIIDHDLDNLLNHTSFVICYWDEHVGGGAGTAGELTLAHVHKIPVLMVLGMPRRAVSSWALGCVTEVFESFDELRAFLAADPVTA